ncbi:RING finger protein 141-like [Thrips palmi]|uniref:RING finger protein 141-like n=1 Tax=Thrips palmi TaxID=161013 RepID=A0A6P8Y5T0_THRPL|nr:RING finger protein 141-like [Thrips palmi]
MPSRASPAALRDKGFYLIGFRACKINWRSAIRITGLCVPQFVSRLKALCILCLSIAGGITSFAPEERKLEVVSWSSFGTKAMECHICMEDFDSTLRRPKCIVPCGHTVCQQCLGNLKNQVCPVCRKEFSGPLTSLLDNYAVLNLVENKQRPKSPSSTSIPTNK